MRYRRLAISRRKGDFFKKHLISKFLIEQVNIPTKSGRIVLLDLTDKARDYLEKAGLEVRRRKFNEGLEHGFWKHKVAEYYQKQGYETKIEEPVNGFTDLVIEKDGEKIAVEIETGKSDWKRNIEKNLRKGFSKIIILATRPELLPTIQETVARNWRNQGLIEVCTQDII